MMNRSVASQGITYLFYVLVQVLLGSQLILFDKAFAFLYVGFLLMLPFETGPLLLMTVGFFTGLSVDIFYDTVGINATACLIIMYIRPFVVNSLMPQGGVEIGTSPSMKNMGWMWFTTYSLLLVFIHHLVLFFMEAFSFRSFLHTLTNVLASTLLTFFTLVLIQLAFYSKSKSK